MGWLALLVHQMLICMGGLTEQAPSISRFARLGWAKPKSQLGGSRRCGGERGHFWGDGMTQV